jgi:TRAP-type mannitol/chloroaromatic compound transport system permease large subunit
MEDDFNYFSSKILGKDKFYFVPHLLVNIPRENKDIMIIIIIAISFEAFPFIRYEISCLLLVSILHPSGGPYATDHIIH